MYSNKKVTKEVDIGEALTVKAIGASPVDHLFYLAFKPPSPMYPIRPPSKDCIVVGLIGAALSIVMTAQYPRLVE